MIELPSLPKSYTTRQIACVSCGETFAVTEEYVQINHEAINGRGARERWRIAPDNNPVTKLRFQDDRQQRPILPPARAAPDEALPRSYVDVQPDNHDNFINCPRCGADNRNWAQILTRPRSSLDLNLKNLPVLPIVMLTAVTLAIFVLFAYQLFQAEATAFIPVVMAFVVALLLAGGLLQIASELFNDIGLVENLLASFLALTAALVALMAALKLDETTLFTRAIPLAACVFCAGFLPAVLMARQWQSFFQWQRQRRYLPLTTPRPHRSPLLLTGGGVLITFVILAPLFGYILAPIGVNTFVDIVTPTETVNPRQVVVNLNRNVEAWLEQPAIPGRGAVQKLNLTLIDYLAHVEINQSQMQYAEDMINKLPPQLPGLPQDVADDARVALTSLEGYARRHSVTRPPEAPYKVPDDIPRKFLGMWVILVSVTGIFGALLAQTAVAGFVNQVMDQSPPPIYYSVANMTRVVAWEAGLALENVNGIRQVQWVDVQRNHEGGIDLIGLHRDLPEFDAKGRPLHDTVRAQRYTITTDMWGRIQTAAVRDVRIPPTVGAPYYVTPTQTSIPLHAETMVNA